MKDQMAATEQASLRERAAYNFRGRLRDMIGIARIRALGEATLLGQRMAPDIKKTMHEHVTSLCRKYEITYIWCRYPYHAWSSSGTREISIPPIKSHVSYATALHEIGHILGRHQQSDDLMVRERWAWEWAKHNAIEWTYGMENFAFRCLDFAAETSTRARNIIPELFR